MKLVKFIIILNKSYIVTSVRIWNYSGPYSDQMRENTDQKNSEYEHFSPVKWELAVHETLCSIVESSTSFLLNSEKSIDIIYFENIQSFKWDLFFVPYSPTSISKLF